MLRVAFEYCEFNKEVSKTINKYTDSDMIKKGLLEIKKVDSIPAAPNSMVSEKLIFTIYEDVANSIVGCFLRKEVWATLEIDPIIKLSKQVFHVREFLVIRTIERKSNYFHLSIEKSLSNHNYNDLTMMLDDIKEQCDIDFRRQLYSGRVFSDNMFTADIFYNAWVKFSRVSARDLL